MDLEELTFNYGKYLKTFAINLVVVLTGVAYVFYQLLTFKPTDVNPLILIAQSIMGIICGVVIKQALGENGFTMGYNSKAWREEEQKYNDACNVANPYMERADNFNQSEEIEKKRNYRRLHLQEIRLKYSDWFDFDGNYIGTTEMYQKLDRKQKRWLNKCIRVRIYPLNLFSQYNVSVDSSTKKEITDKEKRAKNTLSNTLSATLVAIIGVYFIPQMSGWNWASFIAATMQVTLWILFGILQLYTNFNYVLQDKVNLLRRKIELIIKFITGCKNGQYIESPYDKQDIKQVEEEQPKKDTISVQEVVKILSPKAEENYPILPK